MIKSKKQTIFSKFAVALILLTTLVTTMVSAIRVNAAEIDSKDTAGQSVKERQLETSLKKMGELANFSTDITNTTIIHSMTQSFKESLNNGSINLKFKNANLEYNQAKAVETTKDGQTYNAVSIPVVGADYSLISNATALFDNTGKMVSYSETLITKSVDDKFVITTYVDGILANKDKTNVDFMSNTEMKKEISKIHINAQELQDLKQGKSVASIAACIAAIAGINAGIAYVIAGACVASCPGVVPICVACIGAVATIGAADIAGVVACFKA